MLVETDESLKSAIRDSLEARGTLQQMRAKMRAEIFTALDDQAPLRPIREQSDENQLINDCIAQYLEYNGYQSTLTVLKAETANAKGREAVKSKRRRAMEQALKQQWEQYQQDYLGTDSNLPVLYSILSFIPNDSSIQPEIHLPIPLPLEAAELTNRESLAADAAPLSSSDSFESYHSNDQ